MCIFINKAIEFLLAKFYCHQRSGELYSTQKGKGLLSCQQHLFSNNCYHILCTFWFFAEVYERQDDGSRVFTEKKVETCSDIDPKDTWLKSVIALVIIAIILTCLSIVAILVSLCWNSQAAANVAGCFALAALAVLIVSLVVFLFMFSEVR